MANCHHIGHYLRYTLLRRPCNRPDNSNCIAGSLSLPAAALLTSQPSRQHPFSRISSKAAARIDPSPQPARRLGAASQPHSPQKPPSGRNLPALTDQSNRPIEHYADILIQPNLSRVHSRTYEHLPSSIVKTQSM